MMEDNDRMVSILTKLDPTHALTGRISPLRQNECVAMGSTCSLISGPKRLITAYHYIVYRRLIANVHSTAK